MTTAAGKKKSGRLARVVVFPAVFAMCIAGAVCAQTSPTVSKAALHLVLVLDGLRPDSINSRDTPNLFRLKTEGVTFANSHAVFPTVTRVNVTAIATGNYPDRNGIMGNSIYIPVVEAKRAFSNDDAKMLLRIEDRIVTSPSLAELMHAAGERFVAVTSGSTGGALLLTPRSPRGFGTVINGDFDPGVQVAFPKEASAEVLKRFGPAPKKGGAADPFDASVVWAMNVLGDYVLPDLKPRVVISWMTEPDHIQHARGAGAPESIASIRNDDTQIGRLLLKLEAMGLRDRTNIMVLSDHGFGHTVHNVNVGQSLKEAGLMPNGESDEVVLASSGQAMAIHVKGPQSAKDHGLGGIPAAATMVRSDFHFGWRVAVARGRRGRDLLARICASGRP